MVTDEAFHDLYEQARPAAGLNALLTRGGPEHVALLMTRGGPGNPKQPIRSMTRGEGRGVSD